MTREQLLVQARQVAAKAYAPYSHFQVGAALLCADGRVVCGCNVENASYGLTMCAERNAIFQAVAQGAQNFCALAVVGSGATPCVPCGACLQVLTEFAPDLPLYLGSMDEDTVIETTVRDLLPTQFTFTKENE